MMKRLLLIIIMFWQINLLFAQEKKVNYQEDRPSVEISQRPDVAFTNRLGAGGINLRGDITFIANNILSRDSGANTPDVPYDGFSSNGSLFMNYIDIDGDPSTFSSSRAGLNLPACSKVVYAGLYWGGVYPYETWANQEPRVTNFNEIKFKIPGDVNYRNITGTILYDDGIATQKPYVCYSDVTPLLAALGTNANGDYFAADIKAVVGDDPNGLGGAGGWTMVVIYENENLSSKNISVFDGFATIDGFNNATISYSGFQTIPVGPVRAKVLVGALEGDRSIPNDSFQIQNTNGNYVNQFTPNINPRTWNGWNYDYNFFNGSISENDAFLTDRTPDSENTLGFDVDLYNLRNNNNRVIANNQTSASLRFTTTGDVYWAFLNALSVEIIEPKIQMIKTIEDAAGNDISGAPVGLGNELFYTVRFQNVGTDNALNTEIVDLLPKNVDLIESDLILPAGLTAANYTYTPPAAANGFRGELRFNIPDSMVEEGDPAYEIKIKVQVVSSCNDLRDVCSNRIENQAFANYDSDEGGTPRVINEPSFAGIDACNFGIVGTSNFLVDTSGCTFERDQILCGSDTDLVAGNGFTSYSWVNANNPGTVIGTSQTLTVNQAGTYIVTKTAPVGCIDSTETINVIAFNTQPNPLTGFADQILTSCPSNGEALAEIYLCGDGSTRQINLPFAAGSATTVQWFQLDESSCPDQTVAGCANVNSACTWNSLGTELTRTFSDAGEYRLDVLYDGQCPEQYYFNVYKATLNPNIVKEDILCGASADITINNIPVGYEYSLTGPGGFNAPFQTGNTFTVTQPGDYDLSIRLAGSAAAACTYTFPSINIQEETIDLDVITTNMQCANEQAQIRIQANNVPGDYTYTLTQGGATVATFGPVANNDHTFNVTDGGVYTVTVSTPDCTATEMVTIVEPAELNLNPVATKDISCLNGTSDGIITLNASGGTINTGDSYSFAVWSKDGVNLHASIAAIPSTDYFTSTTFNVVNGQEGTYTFLVVDSNNCSTISGPVTINVEPPLQFTHTATNISCSGLTDGRIEVNVVGSDLGFAPIEYSLDGGTNWNTTGVFNNLAANANYTVTIRASKTGYQCNYEITNIAINEPTALAGGSVAATDLSCNAAGATILGTLTFTAPTGGTGAYTYYYRLTGAATFSVAAGTTVSNLPAGTYNTRVEDANGCSRDLNDVTIGALPAAPTLGSSIVYNCDGTANVTITPNVGTYTYSLDGGAAQSNNVFNNVAVGAHTFTVSYGSACTEDIVVNVASGQAFTGSVVGSTDSECNGSDNGTITISANNFTGGSYEYSTDGGTTWSSTADNPYRVVGLAAGTYHVFVRETSGVLNCDVDLGTVTISEPPELTLSASVTQAAVCNGASTGATITAVTNGGGTPPYTFSIDGGATWQSSPVFTNVAPSATDYIVMVRDSRSCNECGCTANLFENGSFESPALGSTGFRQRNEDDVPGWDTTDPSNRIEIWYNNFLGVTPHDGVALAELNARNPGSLYQEYCTEPGDVINWSVAHRGRSGVDVASVRIGGDLATAPVVETMTDGTSAWGVYSGTYTVPVGQSTTVIAFDAVSTATGSLSVGNLIDNVQITIARNSCVPVSVTVDPPQTVTHTGTVTQCYDGSNGEIVVNVTQGNGDYQFSLNGGPWQTPTPSTGTTYTFSGLTPNTYTVDVRDGSGCLSTQTTHVLNPQLGLTTTLVDETCNTGTITINPTGGDSNYQFAVVTSGTAVTVGDFNTTNPVNVAAGTWDVYVRDKNGGTDFCQVMETVTIQRITDPTITTSVVQPNCNGDNGTVNVVISDGTAPFSATINSTTGPFTSNQAGLNTNNVSFTGLASDTYEVIITDANGCATAASTVTVAAPNALTGTASITQPYTCVQQGVITFATPTGGTAPYTYGIDGVFSNNPVKPNLTDATYALVIRDANNCEFTLPSITIAPLPTAPTLGSSIAYNCDGTGNVTITPNVGTYTYSLDGGAAQASNVFNNVSVGSHTFTVDYGSSCTEDIIVNVAAGQEFTATITGNTDSTCNNADDGTITINASNYGGVSYDYSIDGGTNWVNTTVNPVTITGLDNITHDVRVRATVGLLTCPLNLGTVTISEPAAVGVTATITKPATCAAPTGATIEAVATGGTAPYEYSIDGGATWQNSGVFTDVAASGTAYTITARDSRNCASTSNATITVNAPDTVTHTATVTQCYNGSNGEIVVTVTQGNGDYQFSLDGGPWQTPTPSTATTYTFSGLTPNTYTIDVRDGSGCVSAQSTHTLNPQLGLTTTLVDETCNTGTITINPTGGDSNYQFAVVTSGTAVTAGDFNTTNPVNVAAGTWDVYVRDKNGGTDFCQVMETVTIQRITDPTITTSVVQPNCNGDNGTVNVVISDGTAPFSATINSTTGPFTSNQAGLNTNNVSFTGLASDTYEVIITDANGCATAASTVTVAAPNALTGTASITQPYTCVQQGVITFATPTGGTAPYTYGIDGVFSNNPVKPNLTDATYALVIRDANNCEFTLPSITIAPLPTAPTLGSSIAYNCDGTGNVTITPNVGTYTYSLDGGAAQANNVFNNVSVGSHTFTVNYGSSCTEDIIVNVAAGQEFTASITGNTDSTCNNADDGTITINASNYGGASYDYSIDGGANWVNTTVNPVTITGLDNITHDVRVRATVGLLTCPLNLGTVTISEPAAVGVTATITKPATCAAPTGATIEAVATGGTAPYEYSIDGGATWQNSGVFTDVAASGTAYTITARDSRNCASTSNATITVNAPDTVTHTATVTQCYNGSNGEIVVTVTQGNGDYQFSLDGGPWQTPTPSTATTYTFSGLTPNTYTIDVRDGSGCLSTQTTHVLNPQLGLTTTLVDETCNTGTITINPTGGDSNYQFAVVTSGTAVTAGDFNTTNPVNVAAGTWDVYVRDKNGGADFCQVTETVTIQRITDPTITTSVVQPNCNGDNGTVNVVISDGTAPFSATINSTTGPFTSNQAGLNTNNVSFTGLVSDTYEVIITDANGCATAASTVTVAAPTALAGGSAAATDLACNAAGGTILGGITFTAPTGGTTAYSYFYKLSTDAVYTQVVGTSVSNLAAGTYNTRVVDANGCILNLNDVTIAALPTAPTLGNTITYNCDGTGNITVTTAPAGVYTYSLDGGATQATATFSNVAVGPHTITVGYGSGCTTDISVNVEPNNAFDATITASTGNNCNASNDGTITIEAINVTGNFDYSTDGGTNWNTTTSNPFTITGLSAGSQTVMVRPDNSSPAACTRTIGTVILADPTVLSVTAAITKEASCAAPTGATIEATPAGGTAPYRYNINGGAWQTSPVFTGVAASGTAYTINIEDANNCTSSATVTVNSPSAVAFDVVPQVCYDGTNGELVVTVTSGGGNYQFSLNGGPLQGSATNTYTFTGLTNGTYSVTVQDGLGCTTTTNNHIINPQLLATATVTDASCNTGQILVNPTGGAGSYVFSLVAANAAQPADGTFNNTNPIATGNGTYDVYVRDNNGTAPYCQFIIEDVVVNQIPNVALTVTGNQPTCNGDTGSIDLQINAGTGQGPHTIVVTNGAGYNNTVNGFTGTSTSFNNLVAETYTITITDALGCTDTETVTLTDPPVLTATIDPIVPACGTVFTGNESLFGFEFNVASLPVVAPYTLEFSKDNGVTWQTSPVFTGIDLGTDVYPAIRILDTDGVTVRCLTVLNTYTIPFQVTGLIVDPVANPVGCAGGFSVTVQAINGVGPFEFAINSPSGWQPADASGPGALDPTTTRTYNNLVPGLSYVFYVRDTSSGCIEQNDEDVYADFTPTVPITSVVNNQSCFGGTTGQITFSIDNTSGDLSNDFTWTLYQRDPVTNVGSPFSAAYTNVAQTGFADIVVTGLPQGIYYLQVTNDTGTCDFGGLDAEIRAGTPITGTVTKVNDITCDVDGLVRIENVTGGFGNYTYTYTVTNATGVLTGNTITVDDATVTGAPITVEAFAQDINGCGPVSLGTVTLNLSPSPTVAAVPNSCDANKTITITAGSGTPPYQYSTDGGTTYSTPTTSTTYLAEGLTPASYNVIVRDANGCTSPTVATTIQAPLDFTLVQTKNIDCSGTPEAAVEINVTSGSALANYEYEIAGPSAVVARTALGTNPLTFNPTTAGTYTVTIYDTAETPNCSVTKTIDIAARVEPNFTAAATVNDICDGASTGEITITTIDNGILPLNYTITPDPAAAGTISSAAGVVFSNLPAGNYTIRGTSTVNSCFTEQVVEIRDLNPIVPSTPDVTEFECTTGNVVNSATVTLPAGTTGGTGTYTRVVFTYTPATGAVETQDSASLSFTTTNTSGGPVTIVVYDDQGCSSGTVNTNITQFNAISAPIVTVDNDITCNTGEDITVTYTSVAAVTANFTIEGINGTVYAAVTNTTGDFDNLPTGEYKITIENPTTGCELETFHTVGVAPQFDILISDVTNETCRTNDDGSALLDFSPATPYAGNYDYIVYIAATNAPFRTVNGQTGNSPIANLPAGEYYVIATLTSTGAPFCTARSANFTIEEPANPLLVSGVVNPPVSCNGGSDGTITASATGGWGSYQYQLEDLANNVIGGYTYSNNNVFTGLAPGDYRIRVRDANGCPRSQTVNIPNPTLVTFTVAENDNVCDSSTGGSITVTAAGGTGTYVYSLTVGGTVVASQALTATTHTFTNLGGALYVVNVRDSNSCDAGTPTNVTISPNLDFSLTETKKLDCSGTPAAAVSLNVLSGSGNYEYEVVGAVSGTLVAQTAMATNPLVFNPTVADTYTVTITDVGATPNCSINKTIEIQPALQPDFTAVATTNDICNGDSTGVIQLTAADNGILPLTYTISSVPAAAATAAVFNAGTQTYSNLAAAVYTIRGTGTNSCTTDVVVTISENATIDVSGAVTVAEFGCTTGNTTNNATITVDPASITGGTGTFVRVEFIDSGTGTVLQDSGSFVYTSTNEAGGNYTINVYDDKGCLGTVGATIQPFERLIDATITVTKAIDCATGEDITVKINPDIANASYTITGAGTGFTATQVVPVATDSATFTGLATDNYTITITHPVTGCILSTAHIVESAPTFTLDIDNIQNVTCFGTTTGSSELIFSTSTPYTGNYTYEIFNVGGVTTGITGNGVGNVVESLTGLGAGNYYVSVTMTDSPFCPVQSPNFEIQGPAAALGVSGVVNPPVSCNGGSDGTITATGTDGWGSYDYQLEFLAGGVVGTYTYSNNNVFTGLASGDYRIRVRDANGCTSEATVNVPTPTPVTFTVTENDNVCDSSTGGSITVTAAGGTGTYVYSLTVGGTVVASQTLTATTHTFTNLGGALYVVNVRDSNSCDAGTPTNVTISPNLDFSLTETKKLDCSGTPAAAVSLNVLSGSGNYEYEVVGAVSGTLVAQTAMATNPLVFNPTVADTYTVTITDVGATPNCSINKTIEIQPALQPDFTAVATTNDICNGDSTGVIQLTATDNGILPLAYTISSVPAAAAAGATFDAASQTYSNLAAAVYTIRGTGTNSCTTDVVVTISENAIVDASAAITVTEFGCTTGNTTNNATVTVNPANITGGTGTYVRAIFVYDNGTPGDTTDDITQDSTSFSFGVTNEAGGNVSITIFDDKGCIDTETVAIQPFERLIDATITVTKAIDCATGEDITVKINPDIANASYTITGAGTGFTATQVVPVATDSATFTGLATDNYTITITHPVTGCILSTAHIVESAPTFTLDIDNIQNVTCFGTTTGSSELIFSTSTPYTGNYTYEIFNVGGVTTGITGNGVGNVVESLTGLGAGNYYVSVTMTDSPFCPVQSPNFEIQGPAAALGVSGVVNPPVSCNGGSDGTITATGTDGWGSYDYQLEFLAGGVVGTYTYSNNNVFTGLASGDYRIRVRDANGCTSEATVNVPTPTPVTFTVTENDNVCDSSTGGSITVTAAGGTGTYVYSLTVGGTVVASQTLTATTHTFTNLGGALYVVNVRDSNSCDAGTPTNVTISPNLDFSLTETKKLDCSGTPAAAVSLNVLSGSGNYEYEVVGAVSGTLVAQTAMATNPLVFNPTVADTYTVTITDVGATPNCSINKTIEIQPALQPDFTAVATTNDICNGDSTGVIQLTATDNGILPLAYTISSVPAAAAAGATFDAASQTYSNLAAAVYTIRGTGTNSCTTDVVVTISENAIVDASAAITVTEFGCTTGNTTNNATVTVNPANITGGTGTYVRAIFVYDNGTPGDTTDDITQDSTSFSFGVTNEAGGNVSITIFDDKGCIDTETVAIQPFERLIDATITVTKAIDCATGEDITVKINPDIANASYTITGAATGFTATQVVPVATDAATFTGLATDNYTITITHPVTGCILSTAHIVGDAPEFELIVDNIQRACFGGNGSVDLSFNPVTPYADIYTYEIFNVGGATTGITGNGTGNVTTTINNLPAGNYYAVITMPNSPFCSARSANFTIDQPANDLTLAHALTYLKCNQADSGEVKLTAQGGWGVYEYELVNLTTGTTVQAYNNNDAITGLTAGNYQATVRDVNNCTEVITFQLDAGTTITGAFTVTPNDCIGESTATIEVTGVTGGQLQAAPLTYTYVLELPDGTRTTSQASPIFTNLPAGNGYSVIVSDGYSCDGRVGPINIVDPTEATATANITADITCNRPQASVEVTGSGGNGPYMYSNDGINFVNNPIFNVGAGEHQFYVRDNQLCISDPTTITIDPYEALTATLDTSAAIITCNGDSNAVLSANVTGGFGNYEYQLLDNTNAVISGWQQSNSFGGIDVGIYRIAVRSTNAAGDVCTTETAEHQITQPLPLSGNAVPTHVTCFGGNTGSITVNAFDGNGDYEYNITAVPDRPEFPADKYVKNNVFENLSAGEYMITIKDVIGCPLAPIQVIITEPTELNIGLVNVTEQTCLNDPTPTITVDVQGGTQPYFISINNVELATPYSQNQITLGSAEGIAANTVYVISVRDSGGGCAPKALSPLTTIDPVDLRLTVDFEYTCPSGNIIKAIVDDQYKNSMSYTLFDGSGTAVTTNTTGEFIDVAAGNGYTVTATHTVTACSESSTSNPIDIQDIQALTMTIDDSQKNKLIANVDFGLPPYNFTVDGVDMGSDNEFTILQTKDYTITVRDARGCELTLTVRGVYVTITVPNIFTPDGDGINDYWYPLEVEDYHNLRVFIYDRYARKIQNFQGVQQGWDGLYEGKPLPSGDYWYTIYYNELSGEEKKIMGHFTLYR